MSKLDELDDEAQVCVVPCLFLPLALATMSEKQQQLVLSIIDFLNQSIQDGTVKSDDKEGLEVASTSLSHP